MQPVYVGIDCADNHHDVHVTDDSAMGANSTDQGTCRDAQPQAG